MNYTEYLNEKNHIIELIKEIHRWEEDEGFIADGIINFDKYQNSPIKVLVILAESYGYHDCNITPIELQNDEDILGIKNPQVKTPRFISGLLWFLFESLKNNSKIEQDIYPDWQKVNDSNYKKLNDILTSIAYINVKKASKNTDESDNTRLSEYEIMEAITKNKLVLEKQLELINPELIIIASESVKNGLINSTILGDGIEGSDWYKLYNNTKGQKLFFVRHPSYLTDWSYDETYATFEILYKGLTM